MRAAKKPILKTVFSGTALITGELVSVSDAGHPMVDFAGNPGGPMPARFLRGAASDYLRPGATHAPVLLCFENDDPARPILLGVLGEQLPGYEDAMAVVVSTQSRDPAVFEGDTLRLEAKKEITLHCGKCAVTLRQDGKMVLKGLEITSRAAGTHKIKGATVKIN